jgi:hypothetical protein
MNRQLAAVERCFQQLDDQSTRLPLRRRFQRLRVRLAQRNASTRQRLVLSRLSLRFHRLNLLLNKHFLPAPTAS